MKYLSVKDYSKLLVNLRQGFILVGAASGEDDPNLDHLVSGRITSMDVGLDPEEALRSQWIDISKAVENLHTFARSCDAEKPAPVTVRTMNESGHLCRVLPIWAANGPVRKAVDLARAVFTDRLGDNLAKSRIVVENWREVQALAGKIGAGTADWPDGECANFAHTVFVAVVGAIATIA